MAQNYVIGTRVSKDMGIRAMGVVCKYVPRSLYTDGQYRPPYRGERITYVKWDDGTRGWIDTVFLVKVSV